jgi:gliding motility-associated-like protein
LTTTGAQTYSWSPATNLSNPNSSSPVFSGNSGQTYYVTGTAANGCQAKDTVVISIRTANSLLIPPGKSMCKNGSVTLDGNNGTVVHYLWSPGTYLSSTTIINPVANPPVSTSYNLTITDTVCNFSGNFTVFVTVTPLPNINASKSNDIDCFRRNSQLTATGALQYSWSPGATLSSTSIPNPVATPTVGTLYTVTGTDNFGCRNTDTITVFVKGGGLLQDLPGAFTPNGDGKNDCYGVGYWGNVQDLYFIIYNRYGEKVFETHNSGICWDGTYLGRPALAGNYVYYITGRTNCDEVIKKGNVVLIR